MRIRYQIVSNPKQTIYWLNFPESSVFSPTVTLVIDDFFYVDISASIAQGITDEKRCLVLETINEINDKFQFINLCMDENHDIYSCQQFILAGDERIMCMQIMTNLLVFYDLHRRTAEKIHSIMCM